MITPQLMGRAAGGCPMMVSIRSSLVLILALALRPVEGVAQWTSVGIRIGGSNVVVDLQGHWLEIMSVRRPTLDVFVTYRLTAYLSLQPELGFSERGARWQETGILTPGDRVLGVGWAGNIVEIVPQYLDTRLILKLTAPGRWMFRPYVITGPMLGIEVTCRYGTPGRTYSCRDRRLQTTGVEAAVAAGGGVEAGVGSLRFLVEARYVRGLTRIETQWDMYAWSHRSFGLTAGLVWGWRVAL